MSVERLAVDGLAAPVEIAIDRWGIPHIRAANTADLFFAQGFNAARDRLWQVDLWRKRGLGLLAADFGHGFLAQDRAARLFLYRGDMDAEWASYGPDARAIVEAFAGGINAYISLVEREPARLPPEFQVLDTRPSRWQAEDVVRIRTHGSMRNAVSEIVRAEVISRAGAGADRLRMHLEPAIDPHVAPGLDLSSLPLRLLDVYRLATAPVTFSDARLQATPADSWRWSSVTPQGEVTLTTASNNWAVAGTRTDTGRPVLANDPHRPHTLPSLRYLVHLTAPGLDLIGAGEPSFPGIAIGHNGSAAFGLTLFLGPDQEDVYVYRTHPDDPDAYWYNGAWEPMRVIEETAEVRNGGRETLTLEFTRHGPVLYEEGETNRAFALRTVWSEPGTAPYGASLAAMRARDTGTFRDAMKRWRTPPVSYVYADAEGDIAWVTGGLSPIRPNWDGLLPVPGDGRYEWAGFLEPDVLPATLNPVSGFVASANAMNLPPGWPRERHPMGYEWDDPSRARRIEEVLSAGHPHSVGAAMRLQADTLSLPARRLVALLERLRADGPPLIQAQAMFRVWDLRLETPSAAAALLEIWWSRLRPAVVATLVPDERARALVMPGDVESVLGALEDATTFGGESARDGLLRSTLRDAWTSATSLMGGEPATWSWGRIHRVGLTHPVSPIAGAAGLELDVPDIGVGGSDSTLMKAAYRTSDFRVQMGAHFRMVVDVGDWDRSMWITAPGQSGDPRSPHYRDLVEMWANGEYVPMLYARASVDAATERQVILTPVQETGFL